MKKTLLILYLMSQTIAHGQFSFFKPEGSFAIEVSLENTSLTRLPAYRNSIASLAIAGDLIVGGTKAEKKLSPFIFVASLSRRELVSYVDLSSVIPGENGIVSGFAKSGKKTLYAGTMPNGYLIRIHLNDTGVASIDNLGVPVKGEGIFSLALSNNKLYGITHPSGLFFVYDIASRKSIVHKDVAPSPETVAKLRDEFALVPGDYLSKSLIADNAGNIYGTTPINRIFVFKVKTATFDLLKDSVPDVWGRNVLGQVEAWVRSADGKLYGGNAGDGQLFVIDPFKKAVKNLGKPVMAAGIRGLAFGKDGKLYGIAGRPPGYSHLFSYDAILGFKDLGNPQFTMKTVGLEQGIDWRGFVLGSIASSDDGRYIVIGEDETLSQLLVFPVSR